MTSQLIKSLILADFYPTPADSSYGVFFHEQAKQLQALGLQVTVVAPVPWSLPLFTFNPKWRKYTQIPSYAELDGIPVYYPRYFRPPGRWFRGLAGHSIYIYIRHLIKKLHTQKGFDLINAHTLFPPGLAGLLLGKWLNLPAVCTLHGSDIFSYPFENKWTQRIAKQVISETDQLITVSQALKQAAEALALPKHPIRVIYNGVDVQKFYPVDNPETARKTLDLPLNVPLILFVGVDIKRKGLKDLLTAQTIIQLAHPPSRLVVVGASLENIRTLNIPLTEAIASRLIATGVRPIAEIPTWMNACDLLVLPSHSEGFGCVLLEAAACGRPTVGTRVQGIEEAIQDGVTGLLVDKGNPQSLAEAIIKLLDNPDLRIQMGQAGRRLVTTQFQWVHNAQHTINLYRELIYQHV